MARDEAGPESHIDLEAAFEDSSALTILDLVRLKRNLANLFGRKVELIQQGTLKEGVRETVEAEAVLAF
jgi:predicted nucleotidyltransferase